MAKMFLTSLKVYLFRKVNIMDQMVSLLEKYASNLEGIVQDRTKQLAEEKRRTETLLYQMLPRLDKSGSYLPGKKPVLQRLFTCTKCAGMWQKN